MIAAFLSIASFPAVSLRAHRSALPIACHPRRVLCLNPSCARPPRDPPRAVPDQRGSSDPVVPSEPIDLPHEDMDEGGGPATEAEPTATLKTFRTGAKLGYAKPGWAGDVFFGQNVLPGRGSAGRILSVGDAIVATPRRPVGWFSRGVRGVDYWRD